VPPKPISHDRWLKGLQAGFDRMSQPKGSVSRISNIVFTRRGALKTTDGSAIFSALGGMQPLVWNPLLARVWREMVYYQPSSGLRTGYYGLYSDPGNQLAPGGSTVGAVTLTGVSSANGLTGTFYVQVHAADGVGGEGIATSQPSITLSNQGLQISWTAVPNAYGYNVYIGNVSGGEALWMPAGSPNGSVGVSVLAMGPDGTPNPTSVTVDSTWVQNGGQQPESTDTTSATTFMQIVPGGYSGANQIHLFPASVSVISTGGSAATATTTDTQGPPVTTTVPLRPTGSVQGGPSGGTPNDFANPQFAQDGNPATAAVANVPPGGSNGAQRTWGPFPPPPSPPSALVLNVTSSWTLSVAGLQQAIVLISYSLDAGASWQTLFHGAGAYNQMTQSLALPLSHFDPAGHDIVNLRVSVTAAVATPSASGVMSIYEIWVDATVQEPGGFAGGGSTSISTAATPNGGLEGVLGPLPQIVTFRGAMILALGNGYPPYASDGSPGGTVPITNDFTAVYPVWASGVNYNQGDQIEAPAGAINYVFTATQGGTTGTSQPGWSGTLGQTVTDNNIIWKNTGQVSSSPSPRGAAHAEVYAGSLWLANTWPTMTADQLDGPSALRMSILNDYNGWNPLNAAQIAPDDSDECQGIKAFTIAEAGIAPENFLVFFKYFSTYLVQGVFGASNFAITRLQTDLGCIASRTIQFVPGFGIMRLTHLGFAVTDGLNDKLQDPESIRPYLFAESTESDITPIDWSQIWFSKSAQTTDPPMYVAALPLVGANGFLMGQLTGITVTVTGSGSGGGAPGGSFSFSPAAVNFGSVPENTLAQTLIEINFAGSGPVTLNSVSLGGTTFSLQGMPALPYTFNNNGDFTGWYVAINQGPGSYSDVMTVQTSIGTYSVNVTAVVVAGTVVVNPTQLTFAQTAIGGTSVPLTIAVSNGEPVAVELGGYSIDSAPFTPSTDFQFSPVPSFPMTIAPGQTLFFNLVATPISALGAVSATLTILTNLVGVTVTVNLNVFVPSPPVSPASAAPHSPSIAERITKALERLLHLRPAQPRSTIAPLASTTGLPSGNYFVQVGLRGPAGVTSLSPVLGPFTVASGQALLVHNDLVVPPPGFYGYRIWYGTNPTALDQFVDGNSSNFTIAAPGLGGAPPKGIELSLTRLFCYDLVLKAWTVIDLPFSISAMKQFRVVNTIPMTALAGSYDTAIRRWQYGDPDWDLGALATQPDVRVRWNFTDAEIHTGGASIRIFQNQVIIRGAGGPNSISVTPQTNGYLESTFRAALIALGDGQFEARARIMQTMENLGMNISGVGPTVVESATYNVMPKPVNGALIIS
jgi:hypothetical protein